MACPYVGVQTSSAPYAVALIHRTTNREGTGDSARLALGRMGFDPVLAAFPNSPQGNQSKRRIGVDPVGKVLGSSAGLIADAS